MALYKIYAQIRTSALSAMGKESRRGRRRRARSPIRIDPITGSQRPPAGTDDGPVKFASRPVPNSDRRLLGQNLANARAWGNYELQYVQSPPAPQPTAQPEAGPSRDPPSVIMRDATPSVASNDARDFGACYDRFFMNID